eukprot:CAMPEP_0181223656 /NCGR_PEP_ID=MMETSP1096-20121128/30669_1 /TAXON_ID=156174 ORGANISM="Chrysochromulina ericina, Strain CCMP281" /NCGR_SAMPLE_ID=MMETSP1096 /ASSEMBLY_ACC=CAM_ASM_000453 /LENGTH=113 /DNA_ID=CAMNT_0023316605 /DNA_START=111 /DNA_END=452 /DNA_ORIENTATION=+
MQSEVVFRDLDEADLPSVKELHRALFPVQYSDSFYTRLFAEGYFCLVGEFEGEVIAVASARAVDQNGQEARDAYIMTLGVREDYRRLHLGSRSMDAILELLRERTKAPLRRPP